MTDNESPNVEIKVFHIPTPFVEKLHRPWSYGPTDEDMAILLNGVDNDTR